VKDFTDETLEIDDAQEHITVLGLQSSAANLVPDGTVIVCTRIAVGRAALATSTIAINQDLKALFPSTLLSPEFLLRQLQHKRPKLDAIAIGTTVKGITLEALLSLPIEIPEVSEQALIAAILDTLDDTIRYTEQMIAKLKQVRAGLLHDLLTYGIDENGDLRDPVRHPNVFEDGIPTTWVEYTLGEVVPTAEYGISTALRDDGNGIPVLRMNNIFNGEMSLADLKYASEAAVQSLVLRPLDVLFNRTNSIEHVGRTGIWRGQLETASFASYLVRLVPQTSLLEPEFLNHWLNWVSTQIKIRRFATPGVHQVNINPTSLRKSLIALPPKSEQLETIRILTGFDYRLQFETRSLHKLRLLKQGLMDDLLTGRVRVVDLLSAEE
jgi:type I restriction enzyme S subunit